MKQLFLLSGIVALLAITTSSCAATKRDCQGVRKTRLSNGIYI